MSDVEVKQKSDISLRICECALVNSVSQSCLFFGNKQKLHTKNNLMTT